MRRYRNGLLKLQNDETDRDSHPFVDDASMLIASRCLLSFHYRSSSKANRQAWVEGTTNRTSHRRNNLRQDSRLGSVLSGADLIVRLFCPAISARVADFSPLPGSPTYHGSLSFSRLGRLRCVHQRRNQILSEQPGGLARSFSL